MNPFHEAFITIAVLALALNTLLFATTFFYGIRRHPVITSIVCGNIIRSLTFVVPAFVSWQFEALFSLPFDNLWLERPDPDLVTRLTINSPMAWFCATQALSIRFWLLAKAGFAVSFTLPMLSIAYRSTKVEELEGVDNPQRPARSRTLERPIGILLAVFPYIWALPLMFLPIPHLLRIAGIRPIVYFRVSFCDIEGDPHYRLIYLTMVAIPLAFGTISALMACYFVFIFYRRHATLMSSALDISLVSRFGMMMLEIILSAVFLVLVLVITSTPLLYLMIFWEACTPIMEFFIFSWQHDIWNIWYSWWAKTWGLESKTFEQSPPKTPPNRCRCPDPLYMPASILPDLHTPKSTLLGRRRRTRTIFQCQRCRREGTGRVMPSSLYAPGMLNLSISSPGLAPQSDPESEPRPSTIYQEEKLVEPASAYYSTFPWVQDGIPLPERRSRELSWPTLYQSSPPNTSITLPAIRQRCYTLAAIPGQPDDTSSVVSNEQASNGRRRSESRPARPGDTASITRNRGVPGLYPPPRPGSSRSAQASRFDTTETAINEQPIIIHPYNNPLQDSHNFTSPDLPRLSAIPSLSIPNLSFDFGGASSSMGPDTNPRLSFIDDQSRYGGRMNSVFLGPNSRSSSSSTLASDEQSPRAIARSRSIADSIRTFGGTSE